MMMVKLHSLIIMTIKVLFLDVIMKSKAMETIISTSVIVNALFERFVAVLDNSL